MNSSAFEPYIEQEDIKKKCVERLIKIKDANDKWSTFGGAYHYLSLLGEPAEIFEIIDYILNIKNSWSDRHNALHWLNTYPADKQIDALGVIIKRCDDKVILETAKEKLSALLDKYWNLPVEIEKEFGCLVDSNCGFNQERFNSMIAGFATGIWKGRKALKVESDSVRLSRVTRTKIVFRLKAALESEYVEVRVRATSALDSLGDKSGLNIMIEDMSVEDPNDRVDVASALRAMRDSSAIEVFIEAAGDRWPKVRSIAISALGELQAAEAYEVIVSHLDDKEILGIGDGEMGPSQSACYALGALGDRKGVPSLIEALEDEDLKEEACKALRKLKDGDNLFGRGLKGQWEDTGCDAEKWTQWWQWEDIDGKAVQVRVYRNWKEDPAEYEIVEVNLENTG